ncbi:MAG: hypothetical protein ACK46D_15385, partial [Roseiflexaceae bacterium]
MVFNPIVGLYDIDNSVITATVRIRSGLASGDTLALTPNPSTMGPISVASYQSGTGTLTLVGNGATSSEWSTAMRSVTFANSSNNAPGTSRSIGFKVTNASSSSNELSMSFTVVPVNDAPTAVNSTLTGIAEDAADASNTGTAVSTLVANSTDPDASPLKGMAIVGVDNSDGEWQYTLNG